MKLIYPGSFDPLTLGHLDVIKRASQIFEKLTILISVNPDKEGRIPLELRIKLIEESIQGLTNVDIDTFTGLTVDYAKKKGYDAILRGMRGASDFESELEMSQINTSLSDGIETIFLMTSPEHSFIRSSRVWELLKFGGDISQLVPANVKAALENLSAIA